MNSGTRIAEMIIAWVLWGSCPAEARADEDFADGFFVQAGRQAAGVEHGHGRFDFLAGHAAGDLARGR